MLFFFIFSVNDRERVLEEGEFDCPYCQTTRPYLYKEVRPFVSLYFLPLFPVGGRSEFVQCQVCGNSFESDVLPPLEKPKGKRKQKTITELMENAPEPMQEEDPYRQ